MGRALVFADAEVIRLTNRHFIAVTGDDWYQRRRDDVEGRFWRRVADQGPRKGEGGSTRQGIYCFTADGKLLSCCISNDPAVMRQELRKALRAWNALPAARRRPGGVKIGKAGKADDRYVRQPPPDGLIVNVSTRILDRKDGGYCKGTCSISGGDFAARDHLWLTAAECRALVPTEPKKGATLEVPAAVRDRILRFHLVDNTRGEPPHWKATEVRSRRMTLTVTEVTPALVRLRLEGRALLATAADPKKAERGYDVKLLGKIEFDRVKKTIVRFDMVALGEHWGEGTFTRGARPGRTPLGIAFELARGDEPANRVPPQAAREIDQYLGTGR